VVRGWVAKLKDNICLFTESFAMDGWVT
jgi:hypothetical protein